MGRHELLQFALVSSILLSCAKEPVQRPPVPEQSKETQVKQRSANVVAAVVTEYSTYIISKGQHYCNPRPLKTVSLTEMKFFAKFNQSAIYQTINPVNQYDINKLWGFSEGFDNQYNSARIGWGYSNGAIRLYGYVYSKGARFYKEITTILPGQEASCSIKISGTTYVISVNGVIISLPRGTSAKTASGFQQYPYFGGDEVAPQDTYIYIKKA